VEKGVKGPSLDLPDNERDFLAKKGTKIYHFADCPLAGDIPVLKRVGFYSHQMAKANKMKLCPSAPSVELGMFQKSRRRKAKNHPNRWAALVVRPLAVDHLLAVPDQAVPSGWSWTRRTAPGAPGKAP